jgi:DNA-binding protein WhiA
MEKINFKQKAQNELLMSLPETNGGVTAFLSALAKVSGSVDIVKKRVNLFVSTESLEQAGAVTSLLKKLYPAEFEIEVEHAKTARGDGMSYRIMVPAGFTKQALSDLCLMDVSGGEYSSFTAGIPQSLVKDAKDAAGYLKGLFMGCGSIYVPSTDLSSDKKDGYHFEFQFDDELLASDVKELLERFGIAAKQSERGNHFLVYIKDKDTILAALDFLELSDCVLSLQAIIDERETANSINRATICEAANLDKTYAAASKQLIAIGAIEERDGLDSLAPPLKEAAEIRLEYQQASLAELADILGVTKSCLNHRFRRLVEIAGIEQLNR